MNIEQRTIVGVDGSPAAQTALRWAARHAAEHKVQLTIVTAIGEPVAFGSRVASTAIDLEPFRDAARELLAHAKDAVVALPFEGAVETETLVSSNLPAPTLIDMSKDAGMVVVGSRGLGAFRRGLIGSVSTAVAQHAHCPVAVIHETAGDEHSEDGPVVVGVDGTRNSERAIEIAFDEAARRGAQLVAVHAWGDSSSDFDYPAAVWSAAMEAEQASLAESLAGWQEQYPDVQVRRIVVKDRPVRNLVEQSKGAQLLVVGSHGRGGFAGMLLGSTSEALLHVVDCPIIIARGPA